MKISGIVALILCALIALCYGETESTKENHSYLFTNPGFEESLKNAYEHGNQEAYERVKNTFPVKSHLRFFRILSNLDAMANLREEKRLAPFLYILEKDGPYSEDPFLIDLIALVRTIEYDQGHAKIETLLNRLPRGKRKILKKELAAVKEKKEYSVQTYSVLITTYIAQKEWQFEGDGLFNREVNGEKIESSLDEFLHATGQEMILPSREEDKKQLNAFTFSDSKILADKVWRHIAEMDQNFLTYLQHQTDDSYHPLKSYDPSKQYQ